MAENTSYGPFIDRAYDEARDLLIATRDYIAGPSSDDGKALDPGDRLRLTLELARLTRRLTEATAWLMLQKGVAAGELSSMEAAAAAAAQLDVEPDSGPDEAAMTRLPLVARGLIDRARRLHAHVASLERSLRAPPAS